MYDPTPGEESGFTLLRVRPPARSPSSRHTSAAACRIVHPLIGGPPPLISVVTYFLGCHCDLARSWCRLLAVTRSLVVARVMINEGGVGWGRVGWGRPEEGLAIESLV